VPSNWRVSAVEQSALTDDRASRLDFSVARDSKSGARIDTSNGVLSPEFFIRDGSEYLSAILILGQNDVAVAVCHIASGNVVHECWRAEVSPISPAVFGPDYHYVVIASPIVQDSFQILQLPRMERCTGFDGPLERAVAAAFTPDGKQLSVATLDGELWIYSIDPGCKVNLQQKSFNSQLAKWATSTDPSRARQLVINFVSDRDVVVTYKDQDVMDVDTTNGVPKWIRSGLGPLGAGSMSVAASSDGKLLAVWKPTEIQLIHTETGILLSSSVGSSPRPIAKGDIARVAWSGESIVAEWNAKAPGNKARVFLRRLSPKEAESKFLPSVPTSSLINLPPA
jgi:WD40 repeat protein